MTTGTDQSLGEATLVTKCVGELEGHFFVPGYQRGYRWGEPEVRRLLEDVDAARGRPYFLQPIVVKAQTDGKWELVDGQQRLTTLFLILQYIQKHVSTAKPRYTLEYQTRQNSQAYIRELDPARQAENIDFFHIFQAFECIHAWFEHQADPTQAAIDFYTATSRTLQIIWYEAPAHADSKELFRRLNVGRIPLTDAELVKALLLARVRGGDAQSDRAPQLAAQWDVIERDLRNPELWAFVTRMASTQATHIDLILNAMADAIAKPPPGPRPAFHTFETLRPTIESAPKQVWGDVQDMHSMLLGWYEDRTLYHWIGYLVATGDSFGAIVKLARGMSKSQFERELTNRIRQRLKLTEAQVRELEYPSAKCADVLLLMNIEAVRRRKNSSERYSFRAQASGSWSLEHIHAQTAELLTTAEQWTEWLRHHRDALAELPTTQQSERDQLLDDIGAALEEDTLPEAGFRQLEERVVRMFSSGAGETGEEGHSISNLALLASGDNSALSNSVFEVKRREILRRDKAGAYIPACTRNVFLKYYTENDAQQIHFWGPQDRQGYLLEMLNLIGPFLISSSVS